MKIYKITEASGYLGVSINTLKTLANNGKIKSFKTSGGHRRFRQEDLDAYMGVEKEKYDLLQSQIPQWISVDERLPENGQLILIACDHGDTRTMYPVAFNGTKFWGKAFNNVTHWMPLPQPPEVK